MMERAISSTPLQRLSLGGSSSSSLRRRSLISQIGLSTPRDEEHNDDEAERRSLVSSERVVHTPPSSPRRRETITASPQKEHFQGCLKLYAENKINKDNAWNLQLIDFMTSMLRRHDDRMENLQTASTVVDASARIYSFRVDSIHYDVLKMAGGLCKAANAKRGKKDDDAAAEEGAGGEAAPKKKKKRAKGALAAPSALDGDFDANDCIDPFFERLSATAGDITSSNRAFNATLPLNDFTYSLVLNTDQPFLETIKENIPETMDLQSMARTALPLSLLPPFLATDRICEPFADFSISKWDPDTEDNEVRVTNWMDENRLNLSQQAVAFDVNAEVEPIPQDEDHNDLYEEEPLGGLESEEEADAAVAACARRGAPAAAPVLGDMRPGALAHQRLEYSYSGAIVGAWAGPAHWRLKNNKASKSLLTTGSNTARTVDGTAPKKARTKRQLDFLNAGIATDCRLPPPDFVAAQPAKIMISRKTLATGHTWNEANYKTPIDRGLDSNHFRRLFIRRSVLLAPPAPPSSLLAPPLAEIAPPAAPEEQDAPDYDYNNENDASYCVNNVPEGDEWANEDAAAAGDLRDQRELDLLEPPTKVAKIFIPYAMRAKKVDMKQLKHCTWKMLTDTTEEKDINRTTFFNIYSKLPNKLTPNMRECLSVPLALLSVLHLANEKGLILEKRNDMKDIGIVGLIK